MNILDIFYGLDQIYQKFFDECFVENNNTYNCCNGVGSACLSI